MICFKFLKAQWKLVGSLVCMSIFSAIVVLPIYAGSAFEDNGRFKLGEYGSWLQGLLTPFAIVIAAIALKIQFDAQRQTNAIQAEANKRLLMGIMLDNVKRLEGHLNYLAAVACYEEQVTAARAQERGPLGFIEYWLDPPMNLDSPQLKTNKYMIKLKSELSRIILLAKDSETYPLLDQRVIALYNSLCR